MQLKSFFTKSSLWISAALSLIFGVFVFATIDRTVYTTEQLIVVPDTVVSTTWIGIEKILSSELSGDSLYQDFSKINSAYLDKEALSMVSGDSDEIFSPIADEDDAAQNSNTNNLPQENEGGAVDVGGSNNGLNEDPQTPVSVSTESEVEDVSSLEINSTEEVEDGPSETLLQTSFLDKSIFWGGFSPVLNSYPLAQEILVEEASDTAPLMVESEEGDSLDFDLSDDQGDVMTEVEFEQETNEGTSTNDENTVGSIDTEEFNYNSPEDQLIEGSVTKIEDACLGDINCKLYSTIFSGFSMPEFESGTFLASAQLRLSLAAKTKSLPPQGPQRFVVEYNYDEMGEWQIATTIDIEDETSNSINGDHFLVSLEKPNHQSQLANLQVRVSYQGNIEYLERAFIEGLWLQVTSASFYEETDPNFLNGAINYSRDLEAPKFHDLNEANLDPVLSDLPAFTLSYSPQQGFFRRIFNTIFSENEYQVDSVKLTNSHGEVVTVPIDVTYHDNLTWTLQFLKQPQKMIPGKYTMELVINENDTLYADTFEFYWGVLAVNTTKSMYFSGEAVVLNLAALTDKGDTICDASLQLKIIDPTYTIYEIPVERSGACGKNNVTDIPDYLAYFNNASEIGRYTIQLQHLNQKGEVVHNIKDHFEVREYIPFDIERTAPTRIYPPAPYDVTLNITAYRDYSGDIVERVPRGFIFMSTGGAEVVSGPDYTELIWRDVSMVEGDQIKLSYQFDAPDISPYLYLLGPLNMSGFQELRQWQIASDALSAIALLTGTELTSGTNLNIASPEAIEWSFSNIDQYFYTHSTTTAPERITIKQAGDYLISVTLPLERSDANDVLSRVGFEVRVNGVVVPQGIGRSGLIKNQSSNGQRQNESSSHGHFLLTGLAANDYIEVFAQGLTSSQVNAITISGQASLLIENIAIGTGVFAATTTRTTNSVNLNQGTAYPLEWTETRQDIGFVHSDSINPENITISDPGAYLVYVNVPLHSTTTQHRNILGRIRLDGNNIVGGTFSQGYHNVTTVNDINASMHFSGIVIATTTNQVLSVTVAQESAAGNTIVPAGFVGSIYVQKLPTTEIIALRGRNPSTGTNWSSGSALSILWDTQLAYDSTVFTHSTSTNNQDIIINQAGDYVLVYNDALFTTSANTNANVTVYVNGTPQPGAQTKSHYVSAGTGHNDSSGSLVYTLNGLSPTDVVTVRTIRDASSGSLASRDDATILLWKKAEVNFRAEVDSRLGVPFDNIRFASTTPAFEFIADDPDGSSNIVYEFSISTSSSFGTALTYASDVDPGFSNVVTPADTSPFNETERVRYQLQGADALQDGETYYWRVRAKDVTGSGEFGDWSTTQSLTVDMTVVVPYWFQTRDGQFETNDLVGAVSSGFDQFTIDTTPPNEAIYTYSEGTDTSPRYRFWDGSSWGSESSALAVSGTVNRTVNAASSKRDEYVLATIDSSGRTAAQVYSASSSSWSNLVTLSSSVGAVDQRGIAVAYESISGDAVAVSCDGNNAIYRVWNGSSWSNATGLTLPKASQCQSIVIASHPNADEIIAVFRQVSSNNTVGDEDFTAFIWDGTDWEDSIRLGQSQGSNYDRMAVSYNSAGTQAMVIADFNTNPSNFVYTLWDGSSFGAVIAQSGDSVTNRRLHWAQLRANPNSDEIGLCFINSGSSIRAMFWNGISWSGNEQIDAAVNSTAASAVDCRFETTPGRSGNFLVAYSDTTQARYRFYDGLTWSSEANLGSFGQRSPWISMVRTGDGTLVSGLYRRLAARNLSGSEFNGTSWSAPTILETSLTQNVDLPAREPFFLSSRRFQFSEGVVTTQPINFTDVPNQATWGDASFTTTNAIGTDARVRIKYSNSGTCDAYVSNGALPGNDSGFDQASLPINLSGLSTSTYAQICLEATLSTFGDEDISLEEWELTWVRQPKLTQNNYRWFVNGSFVTPVKPWPPSGEDILENQSITAESAVSAGDVLRLRMSLTGQNIDLPVFTEAFKLQFASGLTCSASLVWQDVGEIGSTTAAWRGYGNATVGDDWYDGDWQRRIKITIDSDQVAAAVTDFPVYVDLSNLPTGFFNQVKSDGGDIRVTTSDGLTERPYDLASINTSLQTGELHFKANLSSTTDSEFYIYYGNPAASGYSASATYGSRNVWTNGFDIRYALNENPDNSAPQFLNSGSNSNHATKKAGAGGLTSSNLVTGKIGGGIEHTAANHGATFTQ
ncbi:MAG TPA: hypothetical protein PKD95_04525, partial [Candidatus Paceibacterota bacterium]|nr:hypothetical protein [Candidatus Paceibacterota bacterium]